MNITYLRRLSLQCCFVFYFFCFREWTQISDWNTYREISCIFFGPYFEILYISNGQNAQLLARNLIFRPKAKRSSIQGPKCRKSYPEKICSNPFFCSFCTIRCDGQSWFVEPIGRRGAVRWGELCAHHTCSKLMAPPTSSPSISVYLVPVGLPGLGKLISILTSQNRLLQREPTRSRQRTLSSPWAKRPRRQPRSHKSISRGFPRGTNEDPRSPHELLKACKRPQDAPKNTQRWRQRAPRSLKNSLWRVPTRWATMSCSPSFSPN